MEQFRQQKAAELQYEQEEDDEIEQMIKDNLDEIKDYLPKGFFGGP